MVDQDMLQALRTMMEEVIDRKFDEAFDRKIAPIAKDLEAVKTAIMEIDEQINEIKREIEGIKHDINNLTTVVAKNTFDIELIKTKVAI